MGWDFSFSHMRYGELSQYSVPRVNDDHYSKGERWKKHRRVFHRQFQQAVAPTYWPIQRREAHALLRRLLQFPENLDYHLRQ